VDVAPSTYRHGNGPRQSASWRVHSNRPNKLYSLRASRADIVCVPLFFARHVSLSTSWRINIAVTTTRRRAHMRIAHHRMIGIYLKRIFALLKKTARVKHRADVGVAA